MRGLLIKWHLYAGLLCFPYFVIFGISSINMNHHFTFMEIPDKPPVHWQKAKPTILFKDNQQYANDLRDSLGLMGWAPPWEIQKESGSFKFKITNPGKEYLVTVNLNKNAVLVSEKNKGFWSVFNSMHFFGGVIPNASVFLKSWGVFQNITVIIMLFSIISGVYIFLGKKREQYAGLLVLGFSVMFSLVLMLAVWL